MAEIEGEILIGRSVEDVFDFVADQRNEPQYNRAWSALRRLLMARLGKGPSSGPRPSLWAAPPRCVSN
jgi:plasmid stabilization system protein ParE